MRRSSGGPEIEIGRAIAREMRENGGNEFDARIHLIGLLLDRRDRIRRTVGWELRRAVCDLLLVVLWEPMIPEMVALGREWGIAIDEDVMRRPGPPR